MDKRFTKLDWIIAGMLAALAALIYFIGMAGFAYPGESAHLVVLWRGLDASSVTKYPLMGFFAKLFGAGNLIAPICGVLSVVLVFVLVTFFIRLRINGEWTGRYAAAASRIAGVVAAVMFMITPAVRYSATHLEPRLFALTWLGITLLPFIAWRSSRGVMNFVWPALIGIFWGIGAIDSPLGWVMFPLIAFGGIILVLSCGRKPYGEIIAMFVAAGVALIVTTLANDGFLDSARTIWSALKGYREPSGWLMIMFFSTIPFVVSVFSSNKAFNEQSGWVQWVFHLSLGLASILAVATPLAPSALMEGVGILPCAASAFVAAVAGYLIAYWWILTKARVSNNESVGKNLNAGRARLFAYVGGGILVVVYLFTAGFNFFTFDSDRGAFADRMAVKILNDLGDREWYVSDGTLDDHIRLKADELGKKITLVSLNRDLDRAYLDELSAVVKATGVGGNRNDELSLSLSLGVLPFVQDWFACDPDAPKKVAIFGAPDLWYSAGLTPVPEFAFFGADSSRKPSWDCWTDFDRMLDVPAGWGSYQLWRKKLSPADRMKLELRRHLGFVANNRGVWLQDQHRDDEAFEMYTMVLDRIDSDNICALFNLFEMSRAKHAKALAKKHDYEKRLKAVVDDANRRYRLWSLANYYGYIRNPGIFIRLGFNWARSGRPGEALAQVRRAIDFIPTDRRSSILNMMAALYASEDDRAKSREAYEKVLANDAKDHDALIGMMRLSIVDGDNDKALEYLERAAAAGGDDPRVKVEYAMAALMRNDLAKAKKILREVTDKDQSDLRAWSLLAAVTMQQCDATKDKKALKALEGELENKILPTMEKQSRDPYDYYVQTTKAFILMRKGAERRREARDAFVVAAKARPDVGATRDIVLGLDISLNDTEAAERHARETLRKDRKNPIANYVMGSLALKRGSYAEAEQYLRKSADAKRPVVLAMNDLAEVYRRKKNYAEAERYARKTTELAPGLYVGWETLGTIMVERGGNLEEAQKYIEKAVELSTQNGKAEDVRMLISLARVQVKRGEKRLGRMSLRKVQGRLDELSGFERIEYEELLKSVH